MVAQLSGSCELKQFCENRDGDALERVLLNVACGQGQLRKCDDCGEKGWLAELVEAITCLALDKFVGQDFCKNLESCGEAFDAAQSLISCLSCADIGCLFAAFGAAVESLAEPGNEEIRNGAINALSNYFGIDLEGLAIFDIAAILDFAGINSQMVGCCVMAGAAQACPNRCDVTAFRTIIECAAFFTGELAQSGRSASELRQEVYDLFHVNVEEIWTEGFSQLVDGAKAALMSTIADAVKTIACNMAGGVVGKFARLVGDIVAKCASVSCILRLLSEAACASAKCDVAKLKCMIRGLLISVIEPVIHLLLDLLEGDAIRDAINGFRRRIGQIVCDLITSVSCKLLQSLCSNNEEQSCAPRGCPYGERKLLRRGLLAKLVWVARRRSQGYLGSTFNSSIGAGSTIWPT
ncbi:MAG: hypothetical protein KDB14_06705, partial [Planctomycetales bacterium]|nr:hypothetical protein [Planctomycetales bacterium]